MTCNIIDPNCTIGTRSPRRALRINLVKSSSSHGTGVWVAAGIMGAAIVCFVVALMLDKK